MGFIGTYLLSDEPQFVLSQSMLKIRIFLDRLDHLLKTPAFQKGDGILTGFTLDQQIQDITGRCTLVQNIFTRL